MVEEAYRLFVHSCVSNLSIFNSGGHGGRRTWEAEWRRGAEAGTAHVSVLQHGVDLAFGGVGRGDGVDDALGLLVTDLLVVFDDVAQVVTTAVVSLAHAHRVVGEVDIAVIACNSEAHVSGGTGAGATRRRRFCGDLQKSGITVSEDSRGMGEVRLIFRHDCDSAKVAQGLVVKGGGEARRSAGGELTSKLELRDRSRRAKPDIHPSAAIAISLKLHVTSRP